MFRSWSTVVLCLLNLLVYGQPKADLVARYFFEEGVIQNEPISQTLIDPLPIIDFNTHFIEDRYQAQNSAITIDNGFVDLGTDPVADDRSVTISLWAYAEDPIDASITGIDLANDQYIFHSGGRGNEIGSYILWNNGRVNMGRKRVDSEAQCFYQGHVESNRWYMLSMVYDYSVGFVFMYINRGLVIYSPITGGSFTEDLDHLLLGKSNSWQGNFFNGKIDDLHIYNSALSYREIGQLYSAKAQSDPQIVSTNIETPSEIEMCVYPNPAARSISVSVPAEFEYDGLAVKNITGRTLIYTQRKVNGPAAQTYELPALLNGVHFVQLTLRGQVVASRPIVIQQ